MEQKVRKIGFCSAVGICLGSIVGIGIFLKNDSVGKQLDGNGISWLMTWIISGLIALLVAFHFGKIARLETKRHIHGLTSWTNDIVEKKHNWFKNIVSLNYGFFYNTILVIALSFFTTELLIAFINEIRPIKLEVWVYVLISLAFIVFFVLINYFSIKSSGYISITTTILKFIPLIMVVFIGIIFANTHNLTSDDSTIIPGNGFKNDISFQKAIQGIMISIPATLFAFDAFVGVGTLSKQIKGGEKTVSKVIITSIIIATSIYLLICLSSILHFSSNTTVLNVLIDSLPKTAEKGITIFVSFFLFVAAFGTANGITSACIQEFKHIVYGKKMFFANKLINRFGEEKSSLILCFVSLSIWSIIIYVPSIILNTDSFVDGFSNLVVVYFFLIYAFLIFQYWKNYHVPNNKNNKKNHLIYTNLTWITIASVLIVISLNFFFIIFNGISKPNDFASWGLYLSNENEGYGQLSNLDVLIVYLVISIFFFTFPIMNNVFNKINQNKAKSLNQQKII